MTLEQVTAERDLWRARALGMLEVMNAVEHLVEVNAVSSLFSAAARAAYQDVADEFNTWRRFVEAGVPATWLEAAAAAPELDPDDTPF